jgi:HlyD family secretion protein
MTNDTQALSSLKQHRKGSLTRRRRRWPWVVGAIVVIAVAAMLLVPRKLDVQSTSVLTSYPSAQYAQLTASGYVVAQRRAAVSSKATGRLLELNVREGSPVKKGDLIGKIDAADVRAALAAAAAGVLQAQATAGQADAAVRQAQVELRNAQTELERVKGLQSQGFVSPQAVDTAQATAGQADAAVRQAQVELRNAQTELERVKGLQSQGFVSPQAVDTAQARHDAARAAVNAAQAGLAAARAAVTQARAQVQVQQVDQQNTEIRAPFDGVVLVKNANVGDMITPFSSATGTSGAVVTMADMGTLEVEADVSESNVGKVKVDQPVEIALDALPDARFRGSVGRIVPTVDRAKATVMTKVRFEKLDARVLPEMSARVVFLSQPASDADQKPVIAVNPKAIVERDGKKTVFRISKDDVAEAVPITQGRTLGDAVEITGGALKSGEKLVLSPPDGLKAGQKVAITAK